MLNGRCAPDAGAETVEGNGKWFQALNERYFLNAVGCAGPEMDVVGGGIDALEGFGVAIPTGDSIMDLPYGCGLIQRRASRRSNPRRYY